MTTTTHTGSVHIYAPVEKVFDYVKDPRHLYEAMAAVAPQDPPKLTGVTLTPDGVGSTYEWTSHLWSLLYIGGTTTREEYVPNERIVDRSSTGPVWTFTFQSDPMGTILTVACEISSKLPWLDKVEDVVMWSGDSDLDTMLGNFKKAIET